VKSIFRATAILGSASVINIAIGLVSSKVTAVLLGPSGFGLMALLQAVVSLAATVAGLGVQSGLVRAAARAIADGDMLQEAALRRAGWLICACAGLMTIVLMIIFRRWLSEIAFGTASMATSIIIIAPAVLFSLMAAMQSAVLNARQRIGDLARINVLSAAISLIPTVALVWFFREGGVAPAVVSNLFVLWMLNNYFYRRAARLIGYPRLTPSWAEVRGAARGLLGFGIPYVGSMIVGAGVQTVIPILVLHALGRPEVGLFRAASAIAVNYLAVLLAAMAQDYFPRVSGAPREAGALNRIVNDQLRLVLLVGGPAILTMVAAVPYLVPLLYSHKFGGAADLLEWQLIGDLFKFSSWTMSFVIMAQLGGRTFFLTELAGGGMLLATSWFGMERWGLPGLGIAFLVTSACACALNWLVLWRSTKLRWTRQNAVLFVLLAAAMASVRALPDLGFNAMVTPLAAALAMLFGGYCAATIWREFGGWEGIRTWRSGR
jgi:antigen flippase